MSDKEKVNGSRGQRQSTENVQQEKEKKEKEINDRLEVLRRWFETQGGCE